MIQKLRIWWMPQVPSEETFKVDVNTVGEARKLLNILADYDKFQFEHNIKPDYSNTGGLEVFDGEGWFEFEDDEGNDVWETNLIDTTKPFQKVPRGF